MKLLYFLSIIGLVQLAIEASGQSVLGTSVREPSGTAKEAPSLCLRITAPSGRFNPGQRGRSHRIRTVYDRKYQKRVISGSGFGNRLRKGILCPFSLDAGDQHELPALVLALEANQLTEVNVVAKKPLFEQQMDKLVVNVENMLTAAGGSALDVLERSPGVTVNRQNSGLSLNGKNGVLVLIDGRLNRLPMEAVVQMLSGMNASNIDKVELISNPPAKYDAEGDAGLINIVLKKNVNEGTNGSYSLSAVSAVRTPERLPFAEPPKEEPESVRRLLRAAQPDLVGTSR